MSEFEKAQAAHVEDVDDDPTNKNGERDLEQELVKSRFDSLSITQALWTFRRSAFYTFIVYTAYIVDGFEVTMSGSIVANRGFIQQFGDLQANGTYKINPTWVAAWGAVINVGQIVAMTHIGWVADRYGRRAALYLGWVYAVLCLAVMTGSRVPGVWLFAKILVGMAIGVSQVCVTPYVAEIAPVRARGVIIAIGLVWQQIGSITCSVMMNFVNKYYPDFWLLPIYIEWGLIALMLVCYVLLPETPWHYCRRENKEACLATMRRLYKGIENYDYEEEWDIMTRVIAHEKAMLQTAKGQSWTQVFTGTNGKRMLILLIMTTGQQVCGNSLISTYSTYFFQIAGVAEPFQATMIQTCVALLAICIYVGLIDKIGRRIPACTVMTVMTIALWLIGALFYIKTSAASTVLLVLVCVWQPSFSLYAKSYYVIASELPSLQLRMKTATLVWTWQAILGICLTFAAPPLLAVANIRAAFLFAGLSTPICGLLWFLLPETKARSVAEMDELFEKGIPAWRTGKYVTEAQKTLHEVLAMDGGR